MKLHHQKHRMSAWLHRASARLRPWTAPAGIYSYVLGGLLAVSGTAHADDMDIYTKATAAGGGAPVLAMVLDTSGEMVNDMLKSNGTTAVTLLHERSYSMRDALRAVITSGPANLQVSLTDYSSGVTPDKGRILQEMVLVGAVAGTVGTGPGFTGTVDKRIAAATHDVTQTTAGGIRSNDIGLSIPVKQSISPYSGSISGTWTSSAGAGLGGTAADGVNDSIVDDTKWRTYSGVSGATGNKLYYYQHTNGSNLSQTFTLDSGNADTNTVLFLVDYSVYPEVIVAFNDDRSYTLTCPAGYTEVTSGANAGKCKNGGSIVNKIAVVNKNSTLVIPSITPFKWYKLIVATRDPGKADTFTLNMQDTTKGTFWDTDAASGAEYQKTGLYYENIQIPKNADITSAKLVFSRISATATPPLVRPSIDTNVAAPAFTTQDINSRTVENGDTLTLDNVGANPELDVTGLVKSQVQRDGWCQGNPMAFVVSQMGSALSNWVKVQSFESSSALAPRLLVSYDPASGDPASCEQDRLYTMKIGAMSEDATQFADGSMDVDKKYMPGTTSAFFDERAYLHLSNQHKVGLRFVLAQIPKGAEVKSAKLKFTAKNTVAAQAVRIAGAVSGGNAQAFFDDINHLDSISLTSEMTWTPTAWVNGQSYQTMDISSLVNQQIQQSGWHSESTLGFVLRGTDAAEMKACAWEYRATGNFAPAVAGNLTPADFGSCAAELELVIDDNGNAVEQTYRSVLADKLSNLKKAGNQPLGAAYLKTAEYLANHFSYISTDAIADQGSVDTATPIKPTLATGECASNTIVFVADNNEGAAYNKDAYAAEVVDFVGDIDPDATAACTVSGSGSNMNGKNCSTTVAKSLFNGFTQVGSATESTVKTYTINFGPTAGGAGGGGGADAGSDSGGGTLRGIADKGGGLFKQSGSSAELVKELLAIIKSVSDTGASVAAPGVSVNALNRFEHLDQLYYALFKPSTTVDWQGNMKRYWLKEGVVSGADGEKAVDLVDSFFLDDSRSFWSLEADGSIVTDGGAATASTADARRIFTYFGDNADIDGSALTEQVVLTNENIDEFKLGINLLPNYLVGGTDLENQVLIDQRRDVLIKEFLRATPRESTETLWGAAIHSSPQIVSFNVDDPANPVITVFYGDNRGFLHAIDTGKLTGTPAENIANLAGQELFSFLPQELMDNTAKLHENRQSVLNEGYIYGMDGDILVLPIDQDNGGIGDGDYEKAYLYAGMRRGGKNYYALDVSTARSDVAETLRTPKLQWVIEGGVTGSDFEQMGETWSGIVPDVVVIGGTRKAVLTFGGGYDAARHDHDSNAAVTTDGDSFQNVNQLGRGLYIVDLATGELVLSSNELSTTTFPALAYMKYSVTATPRHLDRDGDGVVDAIYVVDLAGQVFRFEIAANAATSADLVRDVTLIAQLGASATGANAVTDNRRFYDLPSVAFEPKTENMILALTSGYREEPASELTQEALFFFRDVNAAKETPPVSPAIPDPITLADLDNITGNTSVEAADESKVGWYFNLDKTKGEKGIGSPVIFNEGILATTYVPEADISATSCIPNIGETLLYLVDFAGRGLLADKDGDDNPDRSVDIGLPGLGDTTQILFMDGKVYAAIGPVVLDGMTICGAGVRCPLDPSFLKTMHRLNWRVIDEE